MKNGFPFSFKRASRGGAAHRRRSRAATTRTAGFAGGGAIHAFVVYLVAGRGQARLPVCVLPVQGLVVARGGHAAIIDLRPYKFTKLTCKPYM